MRSIVPMILVLLGGCGDKPTTQEDFSTTDITLPGSQVIKTEFVFNTTDALRGMQFRSSMAPDRGMLYAHTIPGKYGYWMRQSPIPLHMIWIESKHIVV